MLNLQRKHLVPAVTLTALGAFSCFTIAAGITNQSASVSPFVSSDPSPAPSQSPSQAPVPTRGAPAPAATSTVTVTVTATATSTVTVTMRVIPPECDAAIQLAEKSFDTADELSGMYGDAFLELQAATTYIHTEDISKVNKHLANLERLRSKRVATVSRALELDGQLDRVVTACRS